MQPAIRKWEDAVSASHPSGFSIMLDPLVGDGDPFCSSYPEDKVNDALVIEYAGNDCDSSTTIGYDHINLDRPYRNRMDFCAHPVRSPDEHIADMTYELGM